MTGLYSPINRLMEQVTRPKGTGAEYMAELAKKPGYKPAEAEDRDLQALMALPQMARAEFMEKLKAQANKFPLKQRELTGEQTHHEDYTLPGGENYREILLHTPMPKNEGFKGVRYHFGGTPNILASVMAKDRISPEGKKILHIEEIQSDWHQQGRKKGYINKEELEAAKKHLKQSAKRSKEAHSMMRDTSGRIIHDLWKQFMDLNDQELQAKKQLTAIKAAGVPYGPHAKDWHELALKAMIQHAAENGYDQIAINHGKTVADRYSLAKAVKHIDATRYSLPSLGPVADVNVVGLNGAQLHAEHGATEEKLAKLLGEELAKKIISQPKESTHRHEGEGLNIGGQGMKGFYDKMVPAFLNKFGKKHGVQVQQGGIQTDEDEMVPDNAGLGMIRSGNKRVAPVHTFDITPAMREDVLKNGIPRYAEGGEVDDDDYRGSHRAPGPHFGAQMHDVSSNGMYPQDFYSAKGLRYYANASDPTDRDAYSKITRVKGKPNAMVFIHRAIPTSVYNEAMKQEAPLKHMIRKGDWVAINKDYAKQHGDSVLRGDYKVASMRVPASHVWTNADSIHEWGYHPEEAKTESGTSRYDEGGSVSRETNLAKFLEPSKEKRRMYHGTRHYTRGVPGGHPVTSPEADPNYTEKMRNTGGFESITPGIRGMSFVSPDTEFANSYAGENKQADKMSGAVYPVYVQVKNPFDYENKEHVAKVAKALKPTDNIWAMHHGKSLDYIKDRLASGDWAWIEDPDVMAAAKSLGHDAMYMNEMGVKNLGVFNPNAIKSAIGNRGTYDPKEPHMNKAAGGVVKEKVTISPNMDVMQYELINRKAK